jgi:hypothetical protein
MCNSSHVHNDDGGFFQMKYTLYTASKELMLEMREAQAGWPTMLWDISVANLTYILSHSINLVQA